MVAGEGCGGRWVEKHKKQAGHELFIQSQVGAPVRTEAGIRQAGGLNEQWWPGSLPAVQNR